ncbi:hypothetical protein HDU85_004360 [Gaertneriomyces sp. JEL0708]|nr:hypothetical protein HDU85_004360 [Gaertneriomyces sp. JEL0708]
MAKSQFVVLGCVVYSGDRTAEPFATYAILGADITVKDAKASLLNQLNARGREIVEFRRLRKEILLPRDMRDFTTVDAFCNEASVAITDNNMPLGQFFRTCNELAEYEGVVNCVMVLGESISDDVAVPLMRGISVGVPPPYAAVPSTDTELTISEATPAVEDSISVAVTQVDAAGSKTSASQKASSIRKWKRPLLLGLALLLVVIVISVTVILVKSKKSKTDSTTGDKPANPPTSGPVQFGFGRQLRSYDMAGKAFPLGQPPSTMTYVDGTLFLPTNDGGYRGLDTSSDSGVFASSSLTFASIGNCTKLNHLTRVAHQSNVWTALCMQADNGGDLRIWENGQELPPVRFGSDGKALGFGWTGGVANGDIYGVAREYAPELGAWSLRTFQVEGPTKVARLRADIPPNRFVVAPHGRSLFVVSDARTEVLEVDAASTVNNGGFGRRTFPSVLGGCASDTDDASRYPDIFSTGNGTKIGLLCYLSGNVLVHQWEVETLKHVSSVPLSSRQEIAFGHRGLDVFDSIAPIALGSLGIMLGLNADKQQVRAWHMTSGALLGSYSIGGEALTWAISADDTKLFIATAARQVQVIELVLPSTI